MSDLLAEAVDGLDVELMVEGAETGILSGDAPSEDTPDSAAPVGAGVDARAKDAKEPEAPAADADPASEPALEPVAAPRYKDPATGKFVSKEYAEANGIPAYQPTPEEAAQISADVAPEPEAPAAEQPPAPQWADFAVTVNKQTVSPFEGAKMLTEQGHTMIVLPEDKAPRLQQVVSRGLHAEREIPQLQAQLKAATAPKPPSENEVAAATIMAWVGKLEEGDPEAVELWNANPSLFWKNVKLEAAQQAMAATQQFHTEQAKAREQEQQSVALQQQREEGFTQGLLHVATTDPALQGLTQEDLNAVYAKLLPLRDALITEHDGQLYLNDEYVRSELAERLAWRRRLEATTRSNTSAQRFNAQQTGSTSTPNAPAPKAKAPVTVASGAAESPRPANPRQAWEEAFSAKAWRAANDND